MLSLLAVVPKISWGTPYGRRYWYEHMVAEQVDDRANVLKHLEGPIVLENQLFLSFINQWCCKLVMKAQLDPFVCLELHYTMMGVIIVFNDLLSTQQFVTNLEQKIIMVGQQRPPWTALSCRRAVLVDCNHIPSWMVWNEERSRKRCCSSFLPMVASGASL